MSSFNLAKKLLPSKKAWKSLAKALKRLTISYSFKKTPFRFRPLRPRIPRKLRLCRSRSHRRLYNHQLRLQKSFSVVYVDQLFAGPVPLHPHKEGSKGSREMGETSGNGRTRVIEEKRKGTIDTESSSSLQRRLQGIDERAEEFIAKFREDMKLEREQSILDFQEMLARSS